MHFLQRRTRFEAPFVLHRPRKCARQIYLNLFGTRRKRLVSYGKRKCVRYPWIPFGTLSPLLPPDLSPKHHWPLCHFNYRSKTVAEVAVAPAATSSRKYDVHDHNMSQFVDLDNDNVCVIAGIVQSSRWRPVSWLLEGCFFLTAWFLEYAGWHSWAMPLQMNLHWNVQQRNIWSSWGNSSLTVADVNNGDQNL